MTPPDSERRGFAEALNEAIRTRGLSLERIRSRLDAAGVPVSIATLSYWKSGRSIPTRARSYSTLIELERILDLTPGHLTALTHTADGRKRMNNFAWEQVLPARDRAARIIDELGVEMPQLSRVAAFDVVTIRADRTEASQDVRVIWRAARSGLHRWVAVLEQDTDTCGALPSVEATYGCRVGPASQPSFRMRRALTEPVRLLGLGVRFDPAALPRAVRAQRHTTLDAEPVATEPIELADNEAQLTRSEAKPGVYSLLWDWD